MVKRSLMVFLLIVILWSLSFSLDFSVNVGVDFLGKLTVELGALKVSTDVSLGFSALTDVFYPVNENLEVGGGVGISSILTLDNENTNDNVLISPIYGVLKLNYKLVEVDENLEIFILGRVGYPYYYENSILMFFDESISVKGYGRLYYSFGGGFNYKGFQIQATYDTFNFEYSIGDSENSFAIPFTYSKFGVFVGYLFQF